MKSLKSIFLKSFVVLAMVLGITLMASTVRADDVIMFTAPTRCSDGSVDMTQCVVTGYRSRVGPTLTGPFNDVTGLTIPATATSYTVVANAPGTTRCYQTAATSAGGDSAFSNAICKSQPMLAPGAPTQTSVK